MFSLCENRVEFGKGLGCVLVQLCESLWQRTNLWILDCEAHGPVVQALPSPASQLASWLASQLADFWERLTTVG